MTREYEDYINEIGGIRELNYRIMYEKYALPNKMTKQEMYNEFVQVGIDYVNDKYNLSCSSPQEVQQWACEGDTNAISVNETISLMCDKGMIRKTEEVFGLTNGWDLARKFEEYREDVEKLSKK